MRPLTRSCFLLVVLGRLFSLAFLFFLGICLRSLWSLPFPLHAPTLISPSLAKVRLSPTLTYSHFTIWCSGQTALFLFFFLRAKAALAYLPTALSVALRPFFPFQLAQYAQVFPLKPAPFCKLFAGLGSTNKTATSLPLSDSRSVLATLSPLLHLSFYLNLSGKNSLSCSIRLQWVPGHSLLPGKRCG